jgi:predicted aspartyl protease
MPTLRGSLDSSHCPTIAIAVSASDRPSEFFDALIDTGFTGFVQLPVRRARELGLTPRAASEIEYADGQVIVGVEFLRVFQKTFVLSITPGLVLLVDSLADLTVQ